jgi:ribosomal protein S18 acetylase RimI-like enzyme
MLINLNKFLKIYFKDNFIKAQEQKYNFIYKYCANINIDYLKSMCLDSNNKILLYGINNKLTENYKNEIIGIIVYRIILSTANKIRIYIPLISIHKNMRSAGYGSLILDELIAKYSKNKTLEIVLLSLESSVDFYNKLGFIKSNVKYIQKNETIDNCIMMKKVIDSKIV